MKHLKSFNESFDESKLKAKVDAIVDSRLKFIFEVFYKTFYKNQFFRIDLRKHEDGHAYGFNLSFKSKDQRDGNFNVMTNEEYWKLNPDESTRSILIAYNNGETNIHTEYVSSFAEMMEYMERPGKMIHYLPEYQKFRIDLWATAIELDRSQILNCPADILEIIKPKIGAIKKIGLMD